MLHDLEEIRHLRDEYKRASGSPGLFHVTRIRFGLNGDPREGLDQGWEELLGDTRLPMQIVTRAPPGRSVASGYGRESHLLSSALVEPGAPRQSRNVLAAGQLLDGDRGALGAVSRVMVNCNPRSGRFGALRRRTGQPELRPNRHRFPPFGSPITANTPPQGPSFPSQNRK
jgi:hypothetical protein